ncbi:MAG: type II secretion system protein [Pyrinomonadaceae bacterium]
MIASNRHCKSLRARIKGKGKVRGYTLVELVVALTMVTILTAVSIPYLFNYRRLYRTEDQALKIMDLMREAGQLAITRRRIMRVEIDLTANQILLIDGNGPGDADDTEVKALPLDQVGDVRMDQIPLGVTPPNPPNYNAAVFAVDAIGHLRGATPVIGNTVWQIAFLTNGSVVNAGTTTPVSATLYIWPPSASASLTPRSTGEVRAITMFGGSGAVRYWKYDGTAFVPSQ